MWYEIAFLKALTLTIVLECFAAALLKKFFGRRLSLKEITYPRLIGTVAIASVLTLPYVWFILPGFIPHGIPYIVTSETVVILAEAIFYSFSLKMAFRNALILSLTANLFSYFIGNVVF